MPSNCIIISWKSKKEMGICRCPLSASGYRLSASGCRLSASGCRLSASRCYCLLDSTPECKRVQAPSAPGFYRSCASRRTMGSGRNRLRLPAWFRGELCMPPLAAFIFIAASGGDTTTLSHAVAVKLKNPKNLRPAGAVNLHAQRACQMGAATTLSREAAVAP